MAVFSTQGHSRLKSKIFVGSMIHGIGVGVWDPLPCLLVVGRTYLVIFKTGVFIFLLKAKDFSLFTEAACRILTTWTP